MTYNPSIPQPNDILSQSQAQIQTNFAQADTIFDVNHITFDNASVASRGKHRRVDLIRVAAPGSIATEAVVYQKLASGSSNLFMQRDGVGTEIQLTGPNPVIAATGTTFLPGGMIMNFGSVVGALAGNTATFATPFPTNVFAITLGIGDSTVTRTATVSSITLNDCLIKCSTGPNTVYYIAIGN